MKHSPGSRLLVAVFTSLIMLVALVSPALGALPFTTQIIGASAIVQDLQPDMSGRHIVWERWNPLLTQWDVIHCDRQTLEYSYPTGAGDQRSPRVSGDRIVWIDYTEADGEVFYDDLDDEMTMSRLTFDANDDVGPDIDGNYIVWMDGTTPGRAIRWFNIETETYGTVPGTNLPNGVRVDKGRIVYWDDHATANWGVYVYDIERDTQYTVTEVSAATTSIRDTDIHGDNVVWVQYANADTDNKDVHLEDIRSGVSGQVTTNAETQEYPSVFGDLLAWQDDRTGDYDVFARWEPEAASYQHVVESTGNESAPAAYGHSVAYQLEITSPSLDYDIGLSVAPLSAQRLSGDDRYETAAAISEDDFSAATTVVLATGQDFPDALAASALAGAYRGPLLLTRAAAIPASVVTEIQRLGATRAILVGGTAVINASVETQLDGLGVAHERVSGANRYATAEQIAYRVMDIENSLGDFCDEAFFVRGDSFADALSVAPHAYARRMPILLVKTTDVPVDTEDAIQFANLTHGYVIGGTSAVSDATEDAIEDLIDDNPGSTGTSRWDGDTRYATARACAMSGVRMGWLDWDTVGVATGQNFPDALGGGAACGAYGSPILLTPSTYIPAEVDSFMHAWRFEFGGMEVYGGTSAISAGVFEDFGNYLD